MILMVAGALSAPPMPSFGAQAKDPIPTFELDRIINFALERNPTIASAQSVIEQNQGRRTQAGAYPNPARSPPSSRMPTVRDSQNRGACGRERRDRGTDSGMAGHAGSP